MPSVKISDNGELVLRTRNDVNQCKKVASSRATDMKKECGFIKMKTTFAFLLIFASAALLLPESQSKLFYGDKVFQLIPKTDEQYDWLQELVNNADGDIYDFWTKPTYLHAPVDIRVSKDFLDEFQINLGKRDMNATISVDDLQKLIDDVEGDDHLTYSWKAAKITTKAKAKTTTKPVVTKGIWERFPRYNEITAWLESICSNYSSIASCGSVGISFEKRDIRYMKLSTGNSDSKRTIYFDAGTHAREWLGVASGIYILNRFLTTYNTDSVAKTMLDTYDWIFVPVLNPDGYEYTRTDRMWRKTRSRRSGVSCIGVDPNRNYDVFWGTTGTSDNPCSEVYHGPSAFSEPETKAISAFLNERKSQILGYFTIHTFGQQWVLPFNDNRKQYAHDYSELLRVAQTGNKALMAVNKARWTYIRTSSSGLSQDYAKLIGIKYTYLMELRPTSGNGLIVGEKQIDPSGRELWAGIKAVGAMKNQ